MDIDEYLKNPCNMASIPYWKVQSMRIPNGTYIVSELLFRMKNSAKFATVSGKCNDSSCPEMLYRKCGFTGSDIWHILRLKSEDTI